MKDDVISRQAAIDVLCSKCNVNKPEICSTIQEGDRWCEEVYGLLNLPSLQSEIIYCKDCKHRGEKPIADGRYWCELHDTFMYYCSDAERRNND